MKTAKDDVKDPICGMTVYPDSDFHAVKDGKTSYFCSDQCLRKFQAQPEGEKLDKKAGGCC